VSCGDMVRLLVAKRGLHGVIARFAEYCYERRRIALIMGEREKALQWEEAGKTLHDARIALPTGLE
jgi:hypothetical protein